MSHFAKLHKNTSLKHSNTLKTNKKTVTKTLEKRNSEEN